MTPPGSQLGPRALARGPGMDQSGSRTLITDWPSRKQA
jgi:hypothetical protein